jgi:4-carboxymuconolactone decarboxylase
MRERMTQRRGPVSAALGASDRTLLRLTVAICLGQWTELRDLRRRAGPGEPDRRWREAVLQAHLFAGFPRVVEALDVLGEVGGLGSPEADELVYAGDRLAAGRALFQRVYGASAPAVRARLEHHHPALARWIEGHAYGRVLGRPGLSLERRELLGVVALAALGQETQLASHVRGALRVGASRAGIRAALDAVADRIGRRRLARARRVVARFARGTPQPRQRSG